jgi:hypothetical protein
MAINFFHGRKICRSPTFTSSWFTSGDGVSRDVLIAGKGFVPAALALIGRGRAGKHDQPTSAR